nr:phosphoribosylformylglycinamidine synthase [bacterium]
MANFNAVRRIYVEKIPGADGEARHLKNELTDNLHIAGLKGVRLLVRYDVSCLTDEDFALAVSGVLSEPQVDRVYPADFSFPANMRPLAVELLPGQYDQRADSAAQCIQLITAGEKPPVRTARIWLFEGDISEGDFARIRSHLINPVEAREASLAPYDTLDTPLPPPEDVPVMEGFIALGEDGLRALREKLGLAMDDGDLAFCQAYFRDEEHRDPTLTEIRMIDTYWSDHCRHTTFLTELTDVAIEDDFIRDVFERYKATRREIGTKKPLCLMDLATIAGRDMKKRGLLPRLDESEEINACSIRVPVEVDGQTVDYLIQFKNETHNHPTEIEPFGGAATCLGGAIRDPLSGRAYVYQAMRITGAGDPRTPIDQTLPGKLPQRRITQGAASGYSSYGNQIGLATGLVQEIYHPGYVAKRMELGAVIGAVPADQVVREEPVPGDIVILLGGRTGRDGCGGATGSSKAHTTESLSTCGAEVQKGNPPEERKLQRLFRHPEATLLIKRCNDFGAGGVSVAIGELADGLDIDLDRVPRKYEGLDGTELAISESQERMAVVVAAKDVETFCALAAGENLLATPVARVTDKGRLVLSWRGRVLCDIARSFLNTNGASKKANARVPAVEREGLLQGNPPVGATMEEKWLDMLGQLNVCSQKGLGSRFDGSIGAGSVLMPFGGKNQLTPTQSMVAKVPLLKGETDCATVMAAGYDPDLATRSPFHAGALSIVDAVAKVVASGADARQIFLSMQEFFERPGAVDTRWGKPLAALLGAYLAQEEMGLAAIGGKDSMSGSFQDMDVPPTIVAIAVAPTTTRGTISNELKAAGHTLWLLPTPAGKGGLPDMPALMARYDDVYALAQGGHVFSMNAIGFGGVAAAATKAAFGNGLGVAFTSLDKPFDTLYGSLLIEADEQAAEGLKALGATPIGCTQAEAVIEAPGMRLALDRALAAWEAPLEGVFPTRTADTFQEQPPVASPADRVLAHGPSIAKPRVLIPVFPGTNCEYDSARAFERAGADVETLVFLNQTPDAIVQSIARMEKAIDNAQIIMLPGGFSGGDEPDGSGKFIAAVLRNPRLTDAIHRLLKQRDGLMLGICNGFQALIKLGLVPYGEIRPMTQQDATLTFNTIGRHQSQMVFTRVASTLSPWLAASTVGAIHTIPVSHGEGRILAQPEQAAAWMACGQVATQYVDASGKPTYDIAFNPNQSLYAIEGLTSPDGRVLGKMGHSERIGQGLYKNIPGDTDQRLFESGVAYFK